MKSEFSFSDVFFGGVWEWFFWFFPRGGECCVVFFPGVHVAFEKAAEDAMGGFEIAAAGAGEHHPAENEGLTHEAVGGAGMEVVEVGVRRWFADGGPDFHVAIENFGGGFADGGIGACFGGVIAQTAERDWRIRSSTPWGQAW